METLPREGGWGVNISDRSEGRAGLPLTCCEELSPPGPTPAGPTPCLPNQSMSFGFGVQTTDGRVL